MIPARLNHWTHRTSNFRGPARAALPLLWALAAGVSGEAWLGAAPARPAGKADHIVVVVWDGMRPDFIRPQYAPNLYALATNGVFFRRHHPVYISSTEVNGTAIATGMYPGHSGVIANSDYRPEMNFFGAFATEGMEAVLRADLLSKGKYLQTPTVPEILQDNGIPTIVAGSKAVALLHDRSSRKGSAAEKESVTLFEGKTLPRSVVDALVKVNDDKAFPTNVTQPNKEQDGWTTRALVRSLWKKTIPKYTLLWLSDPDKSQHETGVGSSTSLAGIESSDKNLGEVIKALNERGVLAKTDLFVVSDHGFSTIQRGPDVVDILKKQKFTATKKFENPEPGDVLVVGLGGTVMFYVMDRVEPVVRRLVEFLQTSDFAGVIFSRLAIEGTFPLETVRYNATNGSPDVIVALRWTPDRNEHGAPGMFFSMDGTKGKGSHASLSRFDMNNTLIASGPDFKKGFASETPSGNIDIAPTVLYLLGVQPPQAMDGRVLHEALAASHEPPPKVETRTLEARREVGFLQWRQYLKFSEVGHAIYFDEGNGENVFRSTSDPD
jgi:predicted AlkP superfamily pyrophosphatase or phosphodiesterase